ncbi:MAG: hypothetical protein WCS31_17520 [Verrucomicrobiae bacterium]
MKSSIASLLAIFTLATAHAGSFGGPPPFSNGSPLTSGISGSYQASARGNNLSGVIRFSYIDQVQTSRDPTSTGNYWAIFYEGQLYKGITEAAIDDSEITGVLSRTTGLVSPAASNGSTLSTVIQGQNLSGYFNAKMAKNSPTGSFKGTGEVQVTLPTYYIYRATPATIQLPGLPAAPTYAQDPTSAQAQGVTQSASQGVPDPSNPAASGYGHLTSAPFKVSGVRTSTTGY